MFRYYRHLMTIVMVVVLLSMGVSPVFAVGPIQNSLDTPQRVPTFSATVTALVPATSATDFLTITGSATKTISIKRYQCDGVSTAAGSAVISVILRSTANTSGTFTNPAAIAMDTTQVAATATVTAYTANPTVGTAIGTISVVRLLTNVAATPTLAVLPLTQLFGTQNDFMPVLRGVNQVFALNGAAASFPAGTTLNCVVEWTEQ